MRLSSRDRAVLDALLPAQAHPALKLGLTETGFDRFLDDFKEAAPVHLWRAFRLALFVAAWVGPALLFRLPPITRLPQAKREAVLVAMSASTVPELRQLIAVLKTVSSLHYGALPQVRQAVGNS